MGQRGQCKGWVARGAYNPGRLGRGLDTHGVFNADMGLDWTGIRSVPTMITQVNFVCFCYWWNLDVCSPAQTKSYMSVVCRLKIGAPTKRPTTKRPRPKTSQLQKVPPHKVPPIKRPNPERSQLRKVPSPKTSQPHNIPTPKRPKPQNVPSLKMSQLQNVPTPKGPNYKTSQASKRPNPSVEKIVYILRQ